MIEPKVIEIPQRVRDLAPAPEDIAKWGSKVSPGWDVWKKKENQQIVGMVHRHCELHKSYDLIPQFIKELETWTDDTMLSGFIGDNEDSNHSLGWHMDPYQVYAFNVEGRTIWEYFSLNDGAIKSVELGELDKMIWMPCGISHQVKVLSEYRTSISLVQQGNLAGLDLPFQQ